MATRKEMAMIRAARAGDAVAQLELGKHYLFGGVGLPKNQASALYWLDRAAQQGEIQAEMLIATDIPFEVAAQTPHARQWYKRAFDRGNTDAGLTYARLVLRESDGANHCTERSLAIAALEAAAHAGSVNAQLLLMQQLGATSYFPEMSAAMHDGVAGTAPMDETKKSALEWAARAAENGAVQAQRALAVHAWSIGDMEAFLRWALPAARVITASVPQGGHIQLAAEDVLLLSRCANTLFACGDFNADELEGFWKLAAQCGDRDAQFSLGLWLARADARGNWSTHGPAYSDYRQATHWLTLAGEQGIAAAWTALAKILRRPNAGQQDWARVHHYVERAAEAGDGAAQLELGVRAWRERGANESNDVRAVYWLQRAAAQGSAEALHLLSKAVTLPVPARWAVNALQQLGAEAPKHHPFLSARVELAALFGLSLPEALLLDVNTADRHHCLLVDIRRQYGRSKRRLVLIQTLDERRALSRITRLFANIDCSPSGPEGAYLKRLYLFRKLVSLPDQDVADLFRPKIKRCSTDAICR